MATNESTVDTAVTPAQAPKGSNGVADTGKKVATVKSHRMAKTGREAAVARVSVVGIVSNAFLGVLKIIIGAATHSIAIITDAVNNLTDTASSIITIIGTHLATRHPDAKHPFGYGRVEYLTSLVIGLTVLFTGVELCRSSIHSIIHPDHVHFNWVAVIVLAATVVVKIFLGQYTLARGRKLDSSALVASGMDARSDAVATGAALFAALLYLWKGISIDAWVGALISLYIVRTGYEILRDTVSKIVGEAASKDLANKIYDVIGTEPIVKGAFDLILNNYGPDYYVGSVNVEVDHQLTAEEICRKLHPLQTRIYRELRTVLVFGIYAVDKSSASTAQAAAIVKQFCDDNPKCLSFHGLFVDNAEHRIYCDVVADYVSDHDSIARRLSDAFTQAMPQYEPVITIDEPFE